MTCTSSGRISKSTGIFSQAGKAPGERLAREMRLGDQLTLVDVPSNSDVSLPDGKVIRLATGDLVSSVDSEKSACLQQARADGRRIKPGEARPLS